MALSSVVRYSGGVTNVGESHGLADLKFPTSIGYSVQQDDFNAYTAANWVIAGTAAGVPALVTGVQGEGGILGVPTTVANPSETSLAMAPTFVASRLKDFFVYARLRLSVADAGMLFGLYSTAASPITTRPADGFFIRKTWTTTPVASIRIAGITVASAEMGPMVSDQWHEFTIAYTAADGALRAFMDGSGVRIATSPEAFPTAPLGLGFSVKTEDPGPGSRNLLIDNYLVAKAR